MLAPEIASIPQYRRAEFSTWTVAADGTMLAMHGPAENEQPVPVPNVIGRNIRDVYANHLVFVRMYERMMQGREIHETTRVDGVHWEVIGAPFYDSAGNIMGASGTSFVLVPDDEPRVRVEEWRAGGDHARFGIWSDDGVIDSDADPYWVHLVRRLPRRWFNECREANPTAWHLIRAYAPRPPLRLVRTDSTPEKPVLAALEAYYGPEQAKPEPPTASP